MWFDTILQSYQNPPVYHEGKKLPGFPSDTLQINTTGQAGKATLEEAYIFYQDCTTAFNELNNPLDADKKLLDFGVGWGRIARFFLRDTPLENIYGIDVMEEFTALCRDTFESPNFTTCAPFPLTQLPDQSFSHVVGYSVFSHLSEAACASWMKEFHRILRPGGIAALTTRGRAFFDYCERLRSQPCTGYQLSMSRMFEDFSAARARYDAGEFVHSNSHGVSGNGAMNESFYGETFIPEKYARTAYSDLFTLEKFHLDPSRQIHPVMIFRKK